MSVPIHYSRGRTKWDNYPDQRTAENWEDFAAAVLNDKARKKGLQYIAAPFKPNGDGRAHRCKEDALPTAFIGFDFDGFSSPLEFSETIQHLQRYKGFAYTTASHTPDAPRARALLATTREMDRIERERISLALQAELEKAVGAGAIKFDDSVYGSYQPMYCPPVGTQTYMFDGAPVDVDAVLPKAPEVQDKGSARQRAEAIATDDPVLQALQEKEMVLRQMEAGKFAVVCPCEDGHSEQTSDTATVYFLPNFGGVKYGKFVCLHASCKDRAQPEFLKALGLDAKSVWAKQAGTPGTPGTDKENNDLGRSRSKNTPGTTGTKDPGKIERPCFMTHDDWFKVGGNRLRPGLYWHDWTGGEDPQPVDTWIASPIHATAITAATGGASWGLLLRFVDPRGNWKEWAAPMAMLKGSGEELRGELLSLGVRIAPKSRSLLNQWLMGRYPDRKITAANRTGWHPTTDGALAFVFPDRTVGSEDIRFQSEHVPREQFSRGGTLEGWLQHVAAPCRGNPVLQLGVSLAFGGPLLKLARLQEFGGAGVHLDGDSSRGKTTVLQAASSVWGGPEFMRSWRATANGMEATAAALNDTLLCLDEIGECSPYEIGAIVYAIANGHGKQRANVHGGSRETARWRVMALSSGEHSLATHMAEAGRRVKAGQEARLLDVPATGRPYGAFDDLHGYKDGRAFADAMKQATAQFYGHAGAAFIERLLDEKRDLPGLLAQTLELPVFAATDGLHKRAAGVFALAGLAGELATEYGLTGWKTGEAMHAARGGFDAWRQHRGEGSTEQRQILQAVQDFLERHGDGRFTALHDADIPIRDRAGYWQDGANGRVYMMTRGALQEAAKGHDMPRIADALNRAGWLADKDTDKRLTKKTRAGGRLLNLYHVCIPEGDA